MAIKSPEVTLVFGVNLTPMKRAMKNLARTIRNTMRSVSSSVKNVLGSLFSFRSALVLTAGVVGLGFLVKKSLDATDNIGKLSKTLGIATRDLATFELAAEIGGSSLQTFAKASRNVSKNVFDFVTRGVGEAVDSFKALGISASDLRPIMNDSVATMGLIADRLNDLPDGAIKTAIAVKLLGGRAVELLPALAGGSKQLEIFRKEAELLGISMSTDAVKGVEDANDAMTRLGFLFKGARDQLVAGFAPALTSLVDLIRNSFLDALKDSGLTVETWARGIVLRTLDMVENVIKTIQSLVNGTAKFINEVKVGLQKAGLLEISDQDRVLNQLNEKKKKQSELFDLIEKREKSLARARERGGKGINDVGLRGLKEQFVTVTAGITEIEDEFKRLGISTEREGPFSDAALAKALAFLEKLRKKTTAALSGGTGDGNNNNKPLDGAGDAVNRAGDVLGQFFDDSKAGFKEWQSAGLKAVLSLENALTNFVTTGKISFGSLISSMIADIARLAIRESITGPLAKALSTAIGSKFPGKAGGGAISGPTLVGERGPELFFPNTTGTIRTNADSRRLSGGRGIIVNVDARGANDPAAMELAARRAIVEAAPQIIAATEGRMVSRSRPGIA